MSGMCGACLGYERFDMGALDDVHECGSGACVIRMSHEFVHE
jgi:hypothetical protein